MLLNPIDLRSLSISIPNTVLDGFGGNPLIVETSVLETQQRYQGIAPKVWFLATVPEPLGGFCQTGTARPKCKLRR
jgi:hypothetical protein